MKNQENFKKINWTIFSILLFLGVVTLAFTLYDLYSTADTTYGEATQSRPGFRWGSLHTIIAIIILLISSFLALGWKRIFPFNVPIAIIVAGCCYMLIFLTFTIGWVGMQGMAGFLIAFIIGVILIISYSVYNFIEIRKTKNKLARSE
ncbi:RND transporter [Halalkalibacillus sediminis]|uniref:RND transporter n=1 Tax=Halalkalibacillus sediminis TaxID=2018042 RepID=A0A2I0QTZ9_9BACI|nr:RND transporter [Halalkalibacillus sediminis]PKR77570.1 RND transporter [Halalkalibacillus sediminis]